MDMEAMKEKINNMMEKAEFDAAVYFDRCTVLAAKLESGEILLAASVADDPATFDGEKAAAECMMELWDRLFARETAPAVQLTKEQAEIVVAMSETAMNATAAAKKLFKSRSAVSNQIAKIKEATGLDPYKFMDMCQLMVVAQAVLKMEE